ncbi:hypothetical protein [Stieleria sp.]|uniref:EamA family transporter n=1 Tax=Stieleria sp. TaxID=2795976 RepID=UPI0035696D76
MSATEVLAMVVVMAMRITVKMFVIVPQIRLGIDDDHRFRRRGRAAAGTADQQGPNHGGPDDRDASGGEAFHDSIVWHHQVVADLPRQRDFPFAAGPLGYRSLRHPQPAVFDDSYHLLFPLAASVLFACGLLFLKRATLEGANPWTVSLVANLWAATLFSGFWFLESEPVNVWLLWQPALVAVFYISGQMGTFFAITHGDVSIAAPLFGIKVLLVAILATLIGGQSLPTAIWLAATLATIGIALVQWTGSGTHSRIGYTILSAMVASTSFSIFDVLVQRFCSSPTAAWSSGRFLPIMFWFVASFSTVFLVGFQREKFAIPAVRRSLLIGGLLIGLQALCIVFTLSAFGDAPRVNVVYSMRGIWGVLLAWGAALIWGGSEADLSRKTMVFRLGGALLITISVVIAILFG